MAVQAPIGNLLALFEANIRKDASPKDAGPAIRRSRSNENMTQPPVEVKHAQLRPQQQPHHAATCSSSGCSSSSEEDVETKQRQRELVKAKVKEFEQGRGSTASMIEEQNAVVKTKIKEIEELGKPRQAPAPTTESTVQKHKKVFDRRSRRSSLGPGVASTIAKYASEDDREPVKKRRKKKKRRSSVTTITAIEKLEKGALVLSQEKPKRASKSKTTTKAEEVVKDDLISKKSSPSSSSKKIGKVQIPDTLTRYSLGGSSNTSKSVEKSDQKRKKKKRSKSKKLSDSQQSAPEKDTTTDTPPTTSRRLPGKLEVPERFRISSSHNAKRSNNKRSIRESSKQRRSKAKARKQFVIPEFKHSNMNPVATSIAEVLQKLADPVMDSINEVLDIMALQHQKDLPKPSPVTRERRFARRASTGRLYRSEGSSPDVNNNNNNNRQWECKPAHAVQVSTNDPITSEAPVRRTARRHSMGSVSSYQSTDETQDFWHTYEESDDGSFSDEPPKQPIRAQESRSDDDEPPKQGKQFARRRTVMFDQNVTVWVFTKENPMEHDLKLPQAFVPPTGAPSDAAPKMAQRRSSGDNVSMKIDQATLLNELSADVQKDFAPMAPIRNSYDSDCSDDSEETVPYYDDDDTSVASIVSAPMEERPRRVRFAEEKNEVVYVDKWIKELANEVILPQAGVIFCASKASSDAPTAPRRRSEAAEEAMANIRASIRGLYESQEQQREAREIDLLPRRPMRRDSLSSMGSVATPVKRARSMELLPLGSRRTLLFHNPTTETKSDQVSSDVLGQEIVLNGTEPAKDAKEIVWGGSDDKNRSNPDESESEDDAKEITWGGSAHSTRSGSGNDATEIVFDVFDVNGVFPTRGAQKRTSATKPHAASVSRPSGDFDPQQPPSNCMQATQKPNLQGISAVPIRPGGWRGYSFKQSSNNPSAGTTPTKQNNQYSNDLRPGNWRGKSIRKLGSAGRMDSTRSFTTDDLIDEAEPSSFEYPMVPSMRPGTMRGNSIRKGLSYRMDSTRSFGMNDAIDEDEPSAHDILAVSSMRPGSMRGNSFRNAVAAYRMDSTRNFTTDDLIHEEEDAPSPSQADRFSAFSMRPGAFRGDSIRSIASYRMDSTRSFTTDDISLEGENVSSSQAGRFSAFPMRPGAFRGDSVRDFNEPCGHEQSVVDEETSPVSNPRFSAFALRPGAFRGDSIRKVGRC